MNKHVHNILVIGKRGQVSFALSQKLKNKNLKFLSSKDIDFLHPEKIIDIIGQYNPSIIINAAAYTNVDLAEEEKEDANKINYKAIIELCKYCQINKVPLIHFSTDYVFDGEKEEYVESDKRNPINFYGKTKLKAEKVIEESLDHFIILRISWVFSSTGKNFVKTMIKNVNEKELSIVNDQFGKPTSAEYCSEIIVKILDQFIKNKKLSGIYHLSNSSKFSWFTFANKIFEIVERNFKVETPAINGVKSNEYKTLANRPKNSVLSTKKIEKNFQIEISPIDKYLEDAVLTSYKVINELK